MWWPQAAVVAAVVFAFHSTLAGTAHLPFDAEFYHYPLLRTVQELLAAGTLPAWDAFTYGGTPLLANAQSAWLYPPHLLLDGVLALIGRPLTQHALDVLAVLHVCIAGVTTCAVARARGLGAAGACFAGVFVVLCGATVSQAQHVGMTETFAWIPLAILVVDRIGADGVTARRVAALGVLFALMLTAGFLPLLPACVALVVGSALVRGPRRLHAALGALGGVALGAAMAGAMLVPLLALQPVFPPLDPHGALPVGTLVTALFPNAIGHWQGALTGYTGIGGVTNSYYYLGAGAAVLLGLALASGRAALAEAALVLALALASFGTVGEQIADAVQRLPTVGPLWRPETLVFVAAVPLALLLARGLARAPTVRQLGVLAAMLVLVVLVPFSDLTGHDLHLLSDAARRTLLALALVVAAVVVACVLQARGRAGAGAALAVAALVAGGELASTVPARYFVNAAGPASSAGPQATGDGSAVLTALRSALAPGERVAADVGNLPAPWSGFGSVWQLPGVNGFQPQFSKYQLARVKATGADFEGRNRTFPIVPAVAPYLDELDVRYVVVPAGRDGFAATRGVTAAFQDGGYHVYRLGGRRARAYTVSAACAGRRGVDLRGDCATGPAVRTTITSVSERRMAFAPSSGARLLVTGEPWYPGWRAETPAGELPVRRAGYLAAVSVPPGTTDVRLSYRAPGLLAGAVLSLLAIAGSLLACLRRRATAPATKYAS